MPAPTPDAVLAVTADRLREAAVPSPAADARLLLAHAWDCTPGELGLRSLRGTAVPEPVRARLADLLERRCAREPLQHITGSAAFRYLELAVGPGVFIPRPETELLVDQVIAAARGIERPRILDLCTGSGAIALAVATEVPGSTVVAVEKEEAALAAAHRNVDTHRHAVAAAGSTVTLLAADIRELPEIGAFDVLVSNPPYIPAGRTPDAPEVGEHDPASALFGGGADGMELPAAVVRAGVRVLRPGGTIVVEHDDTQGAALRTLLTASGFTGARTHRDYTDRDRFTTAALPEES
ncbi:peptide chain release factor N(5)-glutamine methyltransferase [Brevibacterium sp. R8603A2]|uniref:peptide chain release factor N(5)-glutamine methyltransferase n=1 Tax=Brevibacterium sp. R8603A2 TaxID=2929779 RepID=UPI001FF820C5|nr:peptide chain release factor N(5)-glutamine methyltransferase [Brevibacterium sp. R8603A2]MCK1802772.1 peptide chain release factor N(5)-glutamine methyltransferase [Brevibacterium sp. R8603A2]